jgi:hypothetical protein
LIYDMTAGACSGVKVMIMIALRNSSAFRSLDDINFQSPAPTNTRPISAWFSSLKDPLHVVGVSIVFHLNDTFLRSISSDSRDIE